MAADRLRLAKHIHAKGHVMNREEEPGAAVLLAVSQEFGKSVDWLLAAGHTQIQSSPPRNSSLRHSAARSVLEVGCCL